MDPSHKSLFRIVIFRNFEQNLQSNFNQLAHITVQSTSLKYEDKQCNLLH